MHSNTHFEIEASYSRALWPFSFPILRRLVHSIRSAAIAGLSKLPSEIFIALFSFASSLATCQPSSCVKLCRNDIVNLS